MTEFTDLRNHTKTHGKCTPAQDSMKKLRTSQVEIKLDVSDLSCNLCGMFFIELDDIIDHLITEHESNYDKTVCMYMKQYNLAKCTCPICAQHFVYSSFLINHVDESHPVSSYPCEMCLDDFCSQKYLDDHIESAHSETLEQMDSDAAQTTDPKTNSKSVKSKDSLREGIGTILKMSNAILFKYINGPRCFFCSNSTSSNFTMLRNHMSECHNDFDLAKLKIDEPKIFINDLACNQCEGTYDDLGDLIDHLNEAHDAQIMKDLILMYLRQFKIDETVNHFVCHLCKQPLRTFKLLLIHMHNNHMLPSSESILCPKCGLSFRSPGQFKKHFDDVHINAIDCPDCDKEFRNKKAMLKHKRLIHDSVFEIRLNCLSNVKKTKFKPNIIRKRLLKQRALKV